MNITTKIINGLEVLTLQNTHLRVSVVPSLGGKLLSVFNMTLQKEFLWTNAKLPLIKNKAGDEYDPHFIGGMDELLPNDIPETIDTIVYPDHGELWTTPMPANTGVDHITCAGTLPLSGLRYIKTFSLDAYRPTMTIGYEIVNNTDFERNFLWKLHAALIICPGDKLLSDATTAKVVDPEYSRFKKELQPFDWPIIENTDASVVPENNATMDFFYLYDLSTGNMQLLSNKGKDLFSITYDLKIFPYQWYFASYGGFLDHYTAILEPCSNMPISVNDAKAAGQSAVLKSGESMSTRVEIFAGEKNNFIP